MRSGDQKNPPYDHRLHGVLLVAHGMTCPEVAKLLGIAPRTVEYWARGFEAEGRAELCEGERGGRPSVGRKNPVRLDPAAVWDQSGSAARSAYVPAVGFPFAQTAAGNCPGRPETAAGA